jgi:hypothetical protein
LCHVALFNKNEKFGKRCLKTGQRIIVRKYNCKSKYKNSKIKQLQIKLTPTKSKMSMKHYILQKLFQRKSCPRWMALSVIVLNMLFSTNLSAQITQRGSSTTASAATTNGTTITINKLVC